MLSRRPTRATPELRKWRKACVSCSPIQYHQTHKHIFQHGHGPRRVHYLVQVSSLRPSRSNLAKSRSLCPLDGTCVHAPLFDPTLGWCQGSCRQLHDWRSWICHDGRYQDLSSASFEMCWTSRVCLMIHVYLFWSRVNLTHSFSLSQQIPLDLWYWNDDWSSRKWRSDVRRYGHC